MDDKKITIEDIQKMKEAIGEPHGPVGLRVIENQFLPDDVIVVSSKMFDALRKQKDAADAKVKQQ